MTTAHESKPEAKHDWIDYRGLTCCSLCGIVKHADGKNNPCKGKVKVGPR